MGISALKPQTRFFENNPAGLRRLVLFVYALACPGFCLALGLSLGENWLWPVVATGLLCLSAIAWIFIRRQPVTRDWIYPAGIVPVACCGIAASMLGNLSPVFFALTTAPLAWAVVLFPLPVAITALASSSLVCFLLSWQADRPWLAIIATSIFLVIESLMLWVIRLKISHYRGARLASLERNINDIELTLDEQGTIVTVNDRAVRAYGYAERELIGMNIRQLRTPDSRHLVESHLALALDQEQLSFETTHQRRDGSIFPVEVNTRHFESENHRYIQNLVRDISERRRIEDELRRSREQLDLAISGSGLGLWDWQVQTGEVHFSEQWAAMLGYSVAELEPVSIDTWNRLTHPDDLEISNMLLRDHFSGATPEYACEARMRHRDGHWIWILDRGKVSEWSTDGQPVRMIGTHQDISQRKEDEAQMSSMLKSVLAEDDLKERLFTILAHDLRGPIGNLNSLLGMAVDGNFNEQELHEVLVNLKASSESAYSLLDNILQWVRSSMQEITVLKERIMLDELVATVCAWLLPSANAKAIELTNHTGHELSVVADLNMCQTILRNLVSNALKFSPRGSSVRISTGYRPDKQEIRIMVEDEGPGITPEILQRINRREPGKRSRGTAGEAGSGLGLLFCKDLAERMGTRLEVASVMGQGTSCSLVFPDLLDGELEPD